MSHDDDDSGWSDDDGGREGEGPTPRKRAGDQPGSPKRSRSPQEGAGGGQFDAFFKGVRRAAAGQQTPSAAAAEDADAAARRSTHDSRVLETIRDHGWCAVHIRPRTTSDASRQDPDALDAEPTAAVSRIAGAAPTINGVVPGYAYSIGFGLTRDWPEATIFGLSLVQSRAALHRFWSLGQAPDTLMRDAASGRPTGEAIVHGVLPDRPVMIRPISARRYDAYFGTALRAYTSLAEFGKLRVVQIVYPDNAGRWPWDHRAAARFANAQPPLYETTRPIAD